MKATKPWLKFQQVTIAEWHLYKTGQSQLGNKSHKPPSQKAQTFNIMKQGPENTLAPDYENGLLEP